MAWYALYKWFRPWRKIPYVNMIQMYRKHLYDEWYNSLSDEDKKKEDKRIDDLKAKKDKEFYSLLALMKAYSVVYEKYL